MIARVLASLAFLFIAAMPADAVARQNTAGIICFPVRGYFMFEEGILFLYYHKMALFAILAQLHLAPGESCQRSAISRSTSPADNPNTSFST